MFFINKAKKIQQELDIFLEWIDKSLTMNNITPGDFQAITNTYKETKRVKKGIEDYVSLMSTNPTEADQKLTVMDHIEDYLLAKKQYKENIKNKDNIEKIKVENNEMSKRIAAFGIRDLWMPSKMSIQITKDQSRMKRKATLIRFDMDGNVINE